MASTAQFTNTVNSLLSQISTANTNRDGTGTLVDTWQGATGGSRLERITITAAGTTTAGLVRLFITDGTNTRLWREVAVAAVTPSETVPVFRAVIENIGLIFPNSSWKVRAAPHNAETFNIFAEGGNFT